MLTTWLSNSIHIVYSQMTYKHQDRSNYLQHGSCVTYINRVAIQQRLLVEFSCDLHINSLLRALLTCVIIGLCVQWLPQYFVLLLMFYTQIITATIKLLHKSVNSVKSYNNLCFVYLLLFMSWTCVRIHFICCSIFNASYILPIFHQLASYIVEETSSYFPC